MGFQILELGNEWMRPIVLAVNDQLSHYNSMTGSPTKSANPPFGRGQVDLARAISYLSTRPAK